MCATGNFEIEELLVLHDEWQKIDQFRNLRAHFNNMEKLLRKCLGEVGFGISENLVQVQDALIGDEIFKRPLSKSEIDQYKRIIAELHETTDLMNEIGKVIDAHGG